MKKKRERKLWNEFKSFINKGSALDLAVGVIIGGAFTSIVSALVNGILKPLINLIPISNSGTGLQTVLRPAVTAADGTIITQALILDWGAVISAIITFILTALVLFLIIKAVNSAKKIGEEAKKVGVEAKKEFEKDFKKLSSKKNVQKAVVEAVQPQAEAIPESQDIAMVAQNLVESKPSVTTPNIEKLLAEILEELKHQNKKEENK